MRETSISKWRCGCVRHNSVLWNCVRLCYICNEKPYTDRTKSSLCFIPSSDFIIGDNCKGGHYLMLQLHWSDILTQSRCKSYMCICFKHKFDSLRTSSCNTFDWSINYWNDMCFDCKIWVWSRWTYNVWNYVDVPTYEYMHTDVQTSK